VTDRVIIPVPGLGVLALDPESYQAALAEGAKLGAAHAAASGSIAITIDPLITVDQLATALALPTTWLDQAAREGRIPSLQFGRWRRFRRSEVEAAIRRNNGQS
jgi:excisionase family DNA binding protein